MVASDENTYAQAVKTWQGLKGLHKSIGRVNAHGYNPGPGGYLAQYPTAQHKQDKRNLDRAVGGPIWTTEYGDHDGSGMMMAANINADIRHARARGWAYWQPIDGRAGPDQEQHWGFIDAKYPKDADDKTKPKLAGLDHAKLFVFAQYSRHIRPGMQIIDPGKDENTVVAYDRERGQAGDRDRELGQEGSVRRLRPVRVRPVDGNKGRGAAVGHHRHRRAQGRAVPAPRRVTRSSRTARSSGRGSRRTACRPSRSTT